MESSTVDTVHPLKSERLASEEKSRERIAYAFVAGYLILLLFNVSIPVILYWISKPKDTPLSIDEVKDLTLAISSAISGLVGVLGFIMGYYFKAKEVEQSK